MDTQPMGRPDAPLTPHILVVDDDAGVRGLLTAVLVEEGYAVDTAVNGQHALARIAASPPCMVFLDLQMPVMTGWAVLAHLQQARAGVPVVFMTAGLSAQTEAQRHHADGYLAKPFDLLQVLDVAGQFGCH